MVTTERALFKSLCAPPVRSEASLNMLGRWLPAFNERAEYPPILIAAPSLLLLVMLVFAPTRLSKLALLSLLACTALISPLQYTTGDPAADFGIASTAFQRLLIALDRFVWTADDERESTFVHGSSKARAPAPGLNIRRLVWSIENTLLMRGAGKRWEVKGVPRGGRELGRARFVVTRFMRAVIVYLAMDALSTSMQADDYFRRRISLEKVSFPHRIVILLSAGLAGALALELLYDLICAVSVGVGLWTPDESPDLFGSIRHANSLRGFWGKTWRVTRTQLGTSSQLIARPTQASMFSTRLRCTIRRPRETP